MSGPTASGKSALAVEMALWLGAEIVSVDSMAVYRGLDVGTAKPTAEQRARVPHHLVDVAAAAETYSIARWLDDAARAVAACRNRGRRVLFVGGTPLYLRALRDGLALLPAADQRAQKPGLMMASIYRTLLREIQADGFQVLHQRVSLTPLRKFWLAWKTQAFGRVV